MGCTYIPLPMDNRGASPLADLRLLLSYRRILTGLRPAAYLGYTIKPNVYGSLAAQSLGIPVINNISGLGTAFITDSWLTHVVRMLYRVGLRRSRRVFFQNEDDRAVFIEQGLVRREQTGLLSGSGVNLSQYVPSPVPPVSDAPVFLLIARLLRDKGVYEFVEAARAIRVGHPRARFQLLGFLDVENRTAISRAEVEGWVGEGAVEYLGSTADVRPFIAAADCVVLPSYREGTPRTLLEAAAMGRPLVATDVPGCREVVVDGVNGLLCRVRDASSLADACRRVIAADQAQRQLWGAAGRRLVEERFDEASVIDAYLSELARLDNRRAPG